MEASKFIKESVRMCSHNRCDDCPAEKIACINDSVGLAEDGKELETYIAIVEKWSAEHPIKTNDMKLEETFGHKIGTFFRDYTTGYVSEKVFKNELIRWLGEEYKDVDKK